MRMKAPSLLILAALIAVGAQATHLGAVETRDPIGYELDEVRDLAFKVESRARSVRRVAEWVAESTEREDREALDRLRDLEQALASFQAEVERRRQSPAIAEDGFRAVQHTYVRAARAIKGLTGQRVVDREFDRLSDAMYELEMYAVDLLTRLRLADARDRDLDLLEEGDPARKDRVTWIWPGF
ncbi:MAG: hypothetical protein ACE5GX_14300 [Thermoanaerobaculia bacterium]